MKNICLAVNTALEPFGYALIKDGRILVEIKEKSSRTFSETLLDKISEQCSLQDIQAIGVVSGPGSYTGIRIGVSYAKTLGLSLNCPVYAIQTLHALALHVKMSKQLFGVIAPSKKGYCYLQLFNTPKGQNIEFVSDIVHASLSELQTLLMHFQSPLMIYGQCEESIRILAERKGPRLAAICEQI